MESENSGFDAGEFYDDGVKEAGLDPEEAVTDSPEQEDSTNVISQEPEKTATSEEPSGEQKAAKDKTGSEAAETKAAEKKEPSADDVQAAIESTKEDEQEVESVIASLLPGQQASETEQKKTDDPLKTGKYVPVGDHIKLRERAQAAEHDRDELRQRLEASATQTGGEKPGEVEKSPLEVFVEDNPDEDLVPAKVQLEERQFQDEKRQKAQAAKEKAEQYEREEQEKKYRDSEAIAALRSRAESSEAEVRKAIPDYTAVTKPIAEANLISDAERLEFLRDPNPAQKFYDICKAKTEALRGVLGGTKTAPKTETTKEEAPKTEAQKKAAEEGELTDDQIFDVVKELLPARGVEDEE